LLSSRVLSSTPSLPSGSRWRSPASLLASLGGKRGRRLGSQSVEEGVQVNVLGTGTVVPRSHFYPQQAIPHTSGRGRSTDPSGKKGHRDGTGPFDPGVLLASLRCSKAKWQVETGHRPKGIKSVRKGPQVYHGDPSVHMGGLNAGEFTGSF